MNRVKKLVEAKIPFIFDGGEVHVVRASEGDWFHSMSPEHQQQYLKEHQDSKYASQAKPAEPELSPEEKHAQNMASTHEASEYSMDPDGTMTFSYPTSEHMGANSKYLSDDMREAGYAQSDRGDNHISFQKKDKMPPRDPDAKPTMDIDSEHGISPSTLVDGYDEYGRSVPSDMLEDNVKEIFDDAKSKGYSHVSPCPSGGGLNFVYTNHPDNYALHVNDHAKYAQELRDSVRDGDWD